MIKKLEIYPDFDVQVGNHGTIKGGTGQLLEKKLNEVIDETNTLHRDYIDLNEVLHSELGLVWAEVDKLSNVVKAVSDELRDIGQRLPYVKFHTYTNPKESIQSNDSTIQKETESIQYPESAKDRILAPENIDRAARESMQDQLAMSAKKEETPTTENREHLIESVAMGAVADYKEKLVDKLKNAQAELALDSGDNIPGLSRAIKLVEETF